MENLKVGSNEQRGEKEISQERDQKLGDVTLDIVEVEASIRPQSREKQSELGELINELNQTNVAVYERLHPTNMMQASAEFLADSTLVHPNYEFGKIDPERVTRDLESLDVIDERIESGNFSQKQKQLLLMIAQDNRKRQNVLKTTTDYNSAQSEEEKAKAREELTEANIELYGAADEATFESILADKFAEIDYSALSEDEKGMHAELKDQLGIEQTEAPERFAPKPETVQRFGELMEMLYSNLFEHIPADKEVFSSEEVVRIVQEIIDEEFGGCTQYRAELARDLTMLEVSEKEKVMKIPEKRAKGEFTRDVVRNIVIGHEVGTHLYRTMVHEENPVAMFHEGAPDSSEFDEGLALCVEQALSGKYEKNRGAFHYINIGLATFRDKNFREIFDIEKTLKTLLTVKPDETPEQTSARYKRAEQEALTEATRCFRGTGEVPSNKDLVYFNGPNKVWKYIEERIDDPERLLRELFLSGKTNQAIPEQQALAYEAHVGGLE